VALLVLLLAILGQQEAKASLMTLVVLAVVVAHLPRLQTLVLVEMVE
jgi:hypothetical protein